MRLDGLLPTSCFDIFSSINSFQNSKPQLKTSRGSAQSKSTIKRGLFNSWVDVNAMAKVVLNEKANLQSNKQNQWGGAIKPPDLSQTDSTPGGKQRFFSCRKSDLESYFGGFDTENN